MVRSRAGGLDGVLIVDKPAGPTSHDVVGLVRRLSATRRVGHGGTLDPFATGVLPLFLGHATRLAEYHLGARKAYRATVCFGAGSTTDDLEGELTRTEGSGPTRPTVEAALAGFLGSIEQIPPAYSAVKVAGRRAYALARAGRSPDLRPRQVTIDRLDLREWDDDDDDRPIAVVDVDCSAGTYIRALARDLGAAVGSAAYLGALTRTASGAFRLEDAVSLDAVRGAAATGSGAMGSMLRPLDAGLEGWPSVALDDRALTAVLRGQAVRAEADLPSGDGPIRLLGPDGRFVAVGRRLPDGRVAPDKVLVDVATSAVGV